MQRQETKVKVPLVIIMSALIILSMVMITSFNIQNKRYEDTIEIYEEYYILDEKMDIIYRFWRDWYPQYNEEEFYIKYHQEVYLRYLELKKIIGEFEK